MPGDKNGESLGLMEAAPLVYIAAETGALVAPVNIASAVMQGKQGDCCECLGPQCSEGLCSSLCFAVTLPCRLTYWVLMLFVKLYGFLYQHVCAPICCFCCDKNGEFYTKCIAGCQGCTGIVSGDFNGCVLKIGQGLGDCCLNIKENFCYAVMLPCRDFTCQAVVFMIELPFKLMYYAYLGVWSCVLWPIKKICGDGTCQGANDCNQGCGQICVECKTDCGQLCCADCGLKDCCSFNCGCDWCHHCHLEHCANCL